MSFFPNSKDPRQDHSSNRTPVSDRSRSMPAQAQPFLAQAPFVSRAAEAPRYWSTQAALYPHGPSSSAKGDFSGTLYDIGSVASSSPASSTGTFPRLYETQMAAASYMTPQPHLRNAAQNFVPAMPSEKTRWESSFPGLPEYQQQSPSRSDGSSSTQVSCMSSPYNDQMPYIKQEGQSDPPRYTSQYVFDHPTRDMPKFSRSSSYTMDQMQPQKPFGTSLGPYGQQPSGDFKYPFDAFPSFYMDSLSLYENQQEPTPELQPQHQSKRRYTTPENASCCCDICGKLFQRANNLRTHMQTHDPNRTHPHMCEYPDCGQSFARKTDLSRHEDSVSVDELNRFGVSY